MKQGYGMAILQLGGHHDGPVARRDGPWGPNWLGTVPGDALESAVKIRPCETESLARLIDGNVDITTLMVGFDLRSRNLPVGLPEAMETVALHENGETWLLRGERSALVAAIRAAGYTISGE